MFKPFQFLDLYLDWRRKRRTREGKASGVLLLSCGGLGDMVLFAPVLPRFLDLSAGDERVSVLVRGDALGELPEDIPLFINVTNREPELSVATLTSDIPRATIIDDDGIDREEHRQYWKAGDVTVSPAWSNHAHVCTSTEPALQIAIHDFPELCFKRNMMSEDPDGHENLRHMVKGVVPSFNSLDTAEDLENRTQKITVTTDS